MKDKELYSLQNWVNQLGAMQITKPNLMMWVNSIPIGPIQEMPHTPLLMYGDLAIDNAIIDIMNQKDVDGGVTTLFNRCRRKNFGQKRRYKFCEERYDEVKVDGLPIRLKYSILNPRYDAESGKSDFSRKRNFSDIDQEALAQHAAERERDNETWLEVQREQTRNAKKELIEEILARRPDIDRKKLEGLTWDQLWSKKLMYCSNERI